MGMQMFTKNGYFDPVAAGLAIGDLINVIAVGAGASGAAGTTAGITTAGTAGGVTSFGVLLTALGGTRATSETQAEPQKGCMGVGGTVGATIPSGSSFTPGQAGTGGAGGFEPGCPVIGGNGGNLWHNMYSTGDSEPSGLGGTGGHGPTSPGGYGSPMPHTPYCNHVNGTIGNRQNGTFTILAAQQKVYSGAGGNGYGAGGAGVYAPGGNAGSYEQGGFVLESLDPIPVTIGKGGVHATAGDGADGICIVFW